ncbi:Cytoplasmic tRNA 2-thiolation protein 2 [Escovopsis weberi]|uniref:Cytoplasmic tRNA 2-thiolation protein 2 n=1 Tax=Escovopsis weberi TaxID=150374 RepID=A0A0N0RTC7_ESCWE|nr:Cytoplasmic tRNA 2-thiolation protein 2 [Escovopsis weberi]
MMTALQDTQAPCRRCKEPDAPYKLRSLPTCRGCVVDYVESKVVKRFGVLTKETRTSTKPVPRRYLAGLSFGPSSSLLAQLLDKTAEYHASRKASSPFEPLVVHVDTDLSRPAPDAPADADTPAALRLAKYRQRFPHVAFECVHLTKALALKTIDWSALPPLPETAAAAAAGAGTPGTGTETSTADDADRLRRFFDALPSPSSRADVLRLLVRHILLHVAMERSYSALLLAHNTTTLASLTLAEVANGRGFAVPWEVNDGLFTVCTYEQQDQRTGHPGRETSRTQFPIYHPVREVLKSEVSLYIDLVDSLADLVPRPGGTPAAAAAVVSHRDLSIEDVMARYFDNVEGPHSGIIANVVRTAGKLDRPAAGSAFCCLCGIVLDEDGDSRWAGELGDSPAEAAEGAEQEQDRAAPSRLCYGCKRSING